MMILITPSPNLIYIGMRIRRHFGGWVGSAVYHKPPVAEAMDAFPTCEARAYKGSRRTFRSHLGIS